MAKARDLTERTMDERGVKAEEGRWREVSEDSEEENEYGPFHPPPERATIGHIALTAISEEGNRGRLSG